MKSYPSIPKKIEYNIPIILQPKYDGSNIRAEWSAKQGFYKFGTKTQLIDKNSKPFGKSINLIKEKYEKDLSLIFKEQKWINTVCFFEFYGPSSFAGQHSWEEEHMVTLFDVNVYKHGFLAPNQFIKLFGRLDVPQTIFEGKLDLNVIEAVRNSILPGMTFEGVIAKGIDDYNQVIMFKIKSQAWLDKLKIHCNNDEVLFNQLV